MTAVPHPDRIFSRTRFPGLKESLIEKYGANVGGQVYRAAAEIYANELAQMDDRGSKAVRWHLRAVLLPGYACYKALMAAGADAGAATGFVAEEIRRAVDRVGPLMRAFRRLPFAYGLLRLAVKPIMKHGFPKEGWTVTWREAGRKRVVYHIHSCLYCEELEKRRAFELCPAFCLADNLAFAPLAPRIVFKREGMLSEGKEICDFCFEKG